MLSFMRHIAMATAVFTVGSFPLATDARTETPRDAEAKRTAPFAQARGTLLLPVPGRQVVGFGQPTAKGTPSSGIVIEAREGAAVVSPCNGLVVYAGEFRSHGRLVIISPGDGYHLLLSGLWTIDVQVGQNVSAGDPIGALGRSSSDGAGPRLKIDLLENSKAIDPTPWWRKV